MTIPMTSSDKGGLESAGQSLDPGEIRRGRHQSLIFGSGSRMSRELFRELSSAAVLTPVRALSVAGYGERSTMLQARRPVTHTEAGRT